MKDLKSKYPFFGLTLIEFSILILLFIGLNFINAKIFYIPFVCAGIYCLTQAYKRGAFNFLKK